MSRRLKIIGLFCRIKSLLQGSFATESGIMSIFTHSRTTHTMAFQYVVLTPTFQDGKTKNIQMYMYLKLTNEGIMSIVIWAGIIGGVC